MKTLELLPGGGLLPPQCEVTGVPRNKRLPTGDNCGMPVLIISLLVDQLFILLTQFGLKCLFERVALRTLIQDRSYVFTVCVGKTAASTSHVTEAAGVENKRPLPASCHLSFFFQLCGVFGVNTSHYKPSDFKSCCDLECSERRSSVLLLHSSTG